MCSVLEALAHWHQVSHLNIEQAANTKVQVYLSSFWPVN